MRKGERLLTWVMTAGMTAALWMSGVGQAGAETVKVGWGKFAPAAALYVLPEFAEKHKVKIELAEFKRFADIRTATASGSIDFGIVGPQDVPLVVAQGETNLVVVMGLAKGSDTMLVKKGVEVKIWKDYVGKRIGVGKGGIAWMKFVAAMEENGIDYGKLDVINIAGGGDEHVKAMQRGEIQAAATWEPWGAMAVTRGVAYYPPTDLGATRTVGPMVAVIVANRKIAETNPEVTQKVVTAMVEAMEHLSANREKWILTVREFTGLESEVATLSLKTVEYDVRLPQETIERMAKFLHRVGILTRDVSAELFPKFYTYRFLEKATGKGAKDLGAK